MRQRPPRAGTFPPSPRTKLSRKWGSGGRLPLSGGDGRRPEGVGWATKSTTWCSPEPAPRRSFRPFWIAPKGARRRGGEMSPKSNGTAQTRQEGQAPPLRGNGPHISRNGRPHGAAPTKKSRVQCGTNGGGKPPPYVATPYKNGAPSGRAPRKWSLLPILPGTRRARQGCRALWAPRGQVERVGLPPL